MKPQDIISDTEIESVHGEFDFGGTVKRPLINRGLLKISCGYWNGSTLNAMLREHELIKHNPKKERFKLTEKGRKYLWAVYGSSDLKVEPIKRNDCADFILNIHYAKRWPSISYAFGLFDGEGLIGVVTYGTPPSSSLRKGLAGEGNIGKVLELNRLVLKHNRKNEASFLVARSLRLLPKALFIVSYADISQGHNGAVYRASNFKYYGLSAKRTDWKLKGREGLHGHTIADEFRGVPNRAQKMREKYGSDFYLEPRSRKHRYIYITGNAKDRKRLTPLIRYKECKFSKTAQQH